MISEESIAGLKEAINIVSIIEGYVKMKRDGDNYTGLCPFHVERTPSFKVSASKQIFKCFGCGKSGDAIDFIMERENKGYIEAIRLIADKINYKLEEQDKRQYIKPPPRLQKLSDKLIEWFEDRGIYNNTLLRFKITEGVEYMTKAKAEVPVICFNYYRNDELINIKFRSDHPEPKDFKLSKSAELIFYNIDALNDEDTAIIVEGEIDCLTLHESGIYNSVSVPNGAATGHQRLDYLDNCWKYFENKKKIVIATDNDEPGLNLREELARRIGKEKCWRIEYPKDCKDMNDVLMKYGEKAIHHIIENATQWPIDGIISMDDMYDEIKNFYEHGYPLGTKVGIPDFDELISFMPGQFTVVTGIPGSGKSEFVDYIISCCSKNHKWSWGICSFENQPSSLHCTKLMEKITGKRFPVGNNPYSRMSQEDFDYSIGMIDTYFNFININKVDVTLDGILHKAKELVSRKGIKGLIIDPWNYIEHKIPTGYTETQYISESLTAIKAFAITTGTHVFLIAHPTKLKKENGKYEIPTLYSISGSAHFFNKSDNGFTVYRDFVTNIVDIHVQKVRFSWVGKIGVSSFSYDPETHQYKSVIT